MATDDFSLKVWRLHPDGCPISPADRTLRGTANEVGSRFCGPFTHANRAGWWLFSPVDLDVTWRGGREFDCEMKSTYSNADGRLITFLADGEAGVSPATWLTDERGGRTKFTWGLVEPGVVQIWTGCIFETPPGWGLQVRSPINCGDPSIRVMEAVLETDWLHYDIWLNVAFQRRNETVQFRRDGWPPLAQLVPLPRESYDAGWTVSEELLNRNTPEGERVFKYFLHYNEMKFARNGKQARQHGSNATKDSTIYYRERQRARRGTEGPDFPD